MKTTVVLFSAAVLGLLPLSVLSLEAFFGVYTAAGTLALAAYDYRRTWSRPRRMERRPSAPRAEMDAVTPHLAGTWNHQTLSA